MTGQARARVAHDFPMAGVAIHLGRVFPTGGDALHFEMPTVKLVQAGVESDARPLLLSDDMARALYEALADHYGHAGHDTRALRKDYDAERARVDKLLAHLTA